MYYTPSRNMTGELDADADHTYRSPESAHNQVESQSM
jgi:hypothetical protein